MRKKVGEMKKPVAKTASALAFACLAANAGADPWEPGVGFALNYSPSYEFAGEGGNSMDGDMMGAKINYASGGFYPMRASIKYAEGNSEHRGEDRFDDADADDRVVNVEIGVGTVFEGEGLELIPYAGLGLKDMRQSFDDSAPVADDNDIATSVRKHRYLYIPIGFYAGSTAPLDQVNIYYNAHFKPLIAGEAEIGRSNAANMTMDNGYGFRFEAGFHVPSSGSWNIFSGVYFEQWDINGSSRGVRSGSGQQSPVIESEPGTKTEEVGLNLGVQF